MGQALFALDAHAEVEANWTIFQRTVAAYRHPDRETGRTMMAALITALSAGVPKPLQKPIALGPTLRRGSAAPSGDSFRSPGLTGRCGHDRFVFDQGQPPEAGLASAAVVDAFDPGDRRDP